MKIALISTWNTACGIATYSAGLKQGLDACGAQCEVLPIDRTTLKYLTLPNVMRWFDGLAKRVPEDADVIHVQNEFGFFAGSYPTHFSNPVFGRFVRRLRARGKPVFVTFHSLPTFLRPPLLGWRGRWHHARLGHSWRRHVARHFDRWQVRPAHAIVHSQRTRRLYLDSGIHWKMLNIIEHHTPSFQPAPESPAALAAVKAGLGLREDAIVLGMFGFVSHYKGHLTAIEALRRLPERYVLLIVGGPHPEAREGVFNEVVEATIQLDLQDRVRITGFVDKASLRRHQSVTDINLAPYGGATELSSSGAVTWALSSGKPVIASKIDAFREVTEQTACMHLVTPDAPAELAHQIDALARDPARQSALVHAAKAYCDAHSFEATGAAHVALYGRVLGRKATMNGVTQHKEPVTA